MKERPAQTNVVRCNHCMCMNQVLIFTRTYGLNWPLHVHLWSPKKEMVPKLSQHCPNILEKMFQSGSQTQIIPTHVPTFSKKCSNVAPIWSQNCPKQGLEIFENNTKIVSKWPQRLMELINQRPYWEWADPLAGDGRGTRAKPTKEVKLMRS